MPYVRGKGIGGSSLLNFMVYLRGSSADYDRWAELVGSEDWAWDRVLRSFQKVCKSSCSLRGKANFIFYRLSAS